MIEKKIILSVSIAAILVGCSSSAVNVPALVKSQQHYEALRGDQSLQLYAPQALFQAGKLYTLSKSAKSKEEAQHFAYLLEQELLLAQTTKKEALLQKRYSTLKEKKTKTLLEAKESALKEAQEEARKAKEEAAGLAQKYQELLELNAKMTSRGLVLTLGDVLFETGKATLLPGATRAIDKLVSFLSDNPERKVLIEGHTDNVGSATYNIDLSLRRAEAVAIALEEKGIDKERIVTRGYGEQYPVASNKDAAGRQQNRRVEIVILNEGDMLEDIER